MDNGLNKIIDRWPIDPPPIGLIHQCWTSCLSFRYKSRYLSGISTDSYLLVIHRVFAQNIFDDWEDYQIVINFIYLLNYVFPKNTASQIHFNAEVGIFGKKEYFNIWKFAKDENFAFQLYCRFPSGSQLLAFHCTFASSIF